MATKKKITVAAIDKEISTFTTNRDTLRHHAHVIAMMIVYHAAPKAVSEDCNGTGDCTRALNLITAMPKSWAAQLQLWFNEFTPIRVNTSAGNVGYDKKYQALTADEKLGWWKIEEGNNKPYYEFSKEPEVKMFDFKAMKKLIERLPDQIDKKIAEGLVPEEDIATAKALKARLENFAVVRVLPTAANEPSEQVTENVA